MYSALPPTATRCLVQFEPVQSIKTRELAASCAVNFDSRNVVVTHSSGIPTATAQARGPWADLVQVEAVDGAIEEGEEGHQQPVGQHVPHLGVHQHACNAPRLPYAWTACLGVRVLAACLRRIAPAPCLALERIRRIISFSMFALNKACPAVAEHFPGSGCSHGKQKHLNYPTPYPQPRQVRMSTPSASPSYFLATASTTAQPNPTPYPQPRPCAPGMSAPSVSPSHSLATAAAAACGSQLTCTMRRSRAAVTTTSSSAPGRGAGAPAPNALA